MDEEKLIILVQEHKCLYNLQHKDYDNNLVKDNFWKEISGELHAQDKELSRTQHHATVLRINVCPVGDRLLGALSKPAPGARGPARPTQRLALEGAVKCLLHCVLILAFSILAYLIIASQQTWFIFIRLSVLEILTHTHNTRR
jgi:hypothetical protein